MPRVTFCNRVLLFLCSIKTGDFEWTQTEQSWILSSFFYGYVASQIAGGFIAGRYGGKWVLGAGNLITAILPLLSPLAANVSRQLFIVIRVIEGLAEVTHISSSVQSN